MEASKDDLLKMHEQFTAEGMDADTIGHKLERKHKLSFYNTSQFTFNNILDDPDFKSLA